MPCSPATGYPRQRKDRKLTRPTNQLGWLDFGLASLSLVTVAARFDTLVQIRHNHSDDRPPEGNG